MKINKQQLNTILLTLLLCVLFSMVLVNAYGIELQIPRKVEYNGEWEMSIKK